MSNRFCAYLFDYTDFVRDELIGLRAKILTEPLVRDSLDAANMTEVVGEFDTFEAAKAAIVKRAGRDGVRQDEYLDNFADATVAEFEIGEFGLLTPKSTRREYGEWAYETVRNSAPSEFERRVGEAIGLARARELPRPNEVSLLQDLNERYKDFLAGEA